MSTERVKHGQTFSLAGTLGANGTLVGVTGNPGALIDVLGYAENKGDIQLNGARAPHKHGATLSDTGTLTNAGTLTVGGGYNSAHGALLGIEGTLTNTGVLVAEGGVYGASGQIDIGSSGLMRSSGTITLAAGAKSGAGATLSDTGRVVNEARGVIDVGGVDGYVYTPRGPGQFYGGSGGVITISGKFDNLGTLNIYDAYRSYGAGAAGTVAVAGVLQNSGTVLVGDSNQFNFASQGALLSIGGMLDNTGTVFVTGGPTTFSFEGSYGPAVAGTLIVTGTLLNQGQITLQSGGSGGHYGYYGRGAQLVDLGTIDNSGTLMLEGVASDSSFPTGGTLLVEGILTNTGVLVEQQNSRIDVSGILTNFAMLTALGGASSVYNDLYVGRGGYTSVSGTLTNAISGTIALNGGLSEKYGPNYATPVEGFGATLSVSGTLVNDGLLIAGGGAGGYPSRFNSDFGAGAAISVALGGILANYVTLDIQQGATSSYGLSGTGGLVTDAARIVNYGVITIAGGAGTATGELLVTTTGNLGSGVINGAGVLLNQGVVYAADGLNLISGVTFLNDGTVENSSFASRLTIDSAISSDPGKTGLIALYDSATIALGGVVASSQTVAFFGDNDSLYLANAATFAGTLSGLGVSDLIDFLKQDITSASTTGDTLAIGVAGGETIDLALAAPLSGLSLTLQSDGSGGTDLLFGMAPGH